MYKSPSRLPEASRKKIVGALEPPLALGLDLHGQLKVAHWNIKGPGFAALHPLFETFAIALANHNDAVAERAVTLGGVVKGTARFVAKASTLPELPPDVVRDQELVRLLADRIELYLEGVRAAREAADELEDGDTVDLLTTVVSEFEKNAWFLRASLEG